LNYIQLITILILTVLIAYVLWNLFFNKKKKSKQKLPESWRNILTEKVSFYNALNATNKKRFEQDLMSFLAHTQVTGVGFKATDTDKILVASSGIIPLFGFPDWYYTNLDEVLLYPNAFNEHFETNGKDRNIGGMVGTGTLSRKMILSKPSLYQGFENEQSKRNVGIHEFVHLLDMHDGAVDGLPENLLAKQYTIPWLKLIHEKTKLIKKGKSDIRPYGATNEAEFFSVVSEYFFKRPELMKEKHPEMFEILEAVFNQDLA